MPVMPRKRFESSPLGKYFCCLMVIMIVKFSAAPLTGVAQVATDTITKQLAMLRGNDPGRRLLAVRNLGLMGQDAKAAVPAIIDALKMSSLRDPQDADDPEFRQDALFSLESIGPSAKSAIPVFIEAIKSDPDPKVRGQAASGVALLGPDAKIAVPELIDIIDNSTNDELKGNAIDGLGFMGPLAKAAIPILAQTYGQSADGGLRRKAADALGRIGPEAKGTAAYLIAGIGKDPDKYARRAVVDALGTFGWNSEKIVPALLVTLTNDQNEIVRRAAADSLASLADDAVKTKKVDAIAALTDVASSVESSPYREQAAKIRSDLSVLQAIKFNWYEAFLTRVGGHPTLVGVVLAYLLLGLISLTLLWQSPWILWRMNELRIFAEEIKLPDILGGGKVSLGHLLLLGFFRYHTRVLDAWVSKKIGVAQNEFARMATVEQRKINVAVPVELNSKVLPALDGQSLRQTFRGNRACLLIWGEGGSGKTSLACQIAKWAMEEDAAMRPDIHRMLQVMIEQDLSLEVGDKRLVLEEVIRGILKNLISADKAPDKQLVRHLLKTKRILVIIDGLSELNESTHSRVQLLDPELDVNAVVVTSRLEETLNGLSKSAIRTLRVQGNRLASFMEGYLQQCRKRELFDDTEFFDGCKRLSTMVGERDITVLLAKLYAEQMIAAKEGHAAEDLPQNIPDLMLEYVNRLNSRYVELDLREVHEAGKITAWECVRQTFRPMPASVGGVLSALGENGKTRLNYLEFRLRLVETIGFARNMVRFTLDPLGEYLAALFVVERRRDDENSWREFLRQADASSGAPQAVNGFLLAVRDCCVAKGAEFGVPPYVVEELAKRVGLDTSAVKQALLEQRVKRLVNNLDIPEADERLAAVEALTKMGPAAHGAVTPLRKLLKDKNHYVRRAAAVALGSIQAESSIPFLIEALNDEEPTVQVLSAAALCGIGSKDDCVVSALADQLESGGPIVRFTFERIFDSFGPRSMDSLRAAIHALDEHLPASRSLAKDSIEAFLDIVRSQPLVFRVAMQQVTGRIGKEIDDFLLQRAGFQAGRQQ
jgi:HEAT repeat protein